MPCYHPLKAWPIGLTDAGKTKYKITPFEVHHIEIHGNDKIVVCNSDFLSPYRRKAILDYTQIPCGQCVGCRLEYSRQWANRCLLELEYHDSAYFVTLTYNDERLPVHQYSDPETGEAFDSYSLSKRDFQLFMKRLRKAFPDDQIRFFAAGEYGGKTFRPHYHAIIFGLHLDDLEVYKRSPTGFVYYNSPKLQRCWSIREPVPKSKDCITPLSSDMEWVYKPLGYCVVANVSWETCAYTARYVMKKLKGAEACVYSDLNIEPPWTLMSRKPGIARQWYDDHPDCYEYEYINIATDSGGRKFRPPKYYDKLYDLDHPEEMAEIKANRKRMAEAAAKAKMANTTLSYLEALEVEERAKINKVKKLKRSVDDA